MLINASHPEENRVAIVVDGILSELDIEIAGQEQSKGNIYKAVVVRVETGLQAAFVDYGAEKLGFLQIGEIHPNLYPQKIDTKNRPRIADILKRGQEILVQVVKEERGNKGAALTTHLSIPGRYMVLMPDSSTKGVSRKINEDSERKKLKRTMAELDLPDNMGYIVRTAGIGKDKDELKRDFDYLVRLFEGIVARQDQIKAPAQLYQESNLAIRSIRDYFATDMDEVLIDSQQIYQDAKDFFALVMPELKHLVKRHRERRPIFSRYQIEEQIEGLAKNQTPLPSGGSIVIDQTEALVAIDVNSGKMASESGIEATALKTNLEAATEVGRQLRLRDLGGLVVIDFIDMRDRKNIREVEQQLRKALKDDKAKVSVGRISQFGLMEMSRQRLKPALSVGSYLECPHCKGTGKIHSTEAQAVSLLRQTHTAASKGQIGEIEASTPVDVANYLLNRKRSTITDLERQLNLRLTIFGKADLLPGETELVLHKREKSQDNSRQIDPVSHSNQIEVALAAQQDDQATASEQKNVTETTTDKDASTPEAAQEGPKKRRRRRRKKPLSVDQQQTPENTENDDAQATLDSDESVPAEITIAGEVQTPALEEKTEEPAEEKPKRRARRPQARAKAVKDPNQEASPSTGDSQKPEAQGEGSSTVGDATADTADVKPQAGPQVQPDVTEKPPIGETSEQETKAAKPRTRRSPRKATTDDAKANVETLETATEETEPKKARRSPRKKPAQEATLPVEAESTASEKKKTPARPRRTSKKSAEETTVTTQENSPAGEESAPKPRAKRTTRRSSANKAAETTSSAQENNVEKTVPGTTNPEVEAPKTKAPRKRRSPAKKTAASSATTDLPPKEQTEETPEKPRRRTRRTTAKPPETVEKTERVVEKADLEETAKPRRRKPTPKKADENTEE